MTQEHIDELKADPAATDFLIWYAHKRKRRSTSTMLAMPHQNYRREHPTSILSLKEVVDIFIKLQNAGYGTLDTLNPRKARFIWKGNPLSRLRQITKILGDKTPYPVYTPTQNVPASPVPQVFAEYNYFWPTSTGELIKVTSGTELDARTQHALAAVFTRNPDKFKSDVDKHIA